MMVCSECRPHSTSSIEQCYIEWPSIALTSALQGSIASTAHIYCGVLVEAPKIGLMAREIDVKIFESLLKGDRANVFTSKEVTS